MKNKILKLKKYLFLISTIFLITSFSHLFYNYLYSDSKLIAIEWWIISEGLVWDFPSLNPFKPLAWNNKYMINLLYRSLLQYDIFEKKITSNIASCDISNLSYIECYLEDNIKWSNWEEITTKDIIGTYKILQNTDINPVMKSLLKDTEILEEDNIVIFKNNKNDINFLNIFFQPIVPQSVINKLWEDNLKWNFSSIDWIYSWKYKITNVSWDLALWITKFILEKNEFYNKNPILIEQLIIKLFSSTNNLLKNKDNINIFNDNENLIWDSIPRFENKKYDLPQYVSIFLNKDKILDVDLRTFLLEQINTENLINILWKNNFNEVNNPFFTETKLDQSSKNKNFENILTKLWYYKKSKLISNNSIEDIKTYSDEIKIEKEDIETDNLTIDTYQKDSEYIVSPDYVDRYNFITQDDILLKWVTPENTQEVYINDYKLSSFTANSRYFYYRLKTSYNSIKEWVNNYKIYFIVDWEKKLYEEINFLYYTNYSKLEKAKKELLINLEIEKQEKELKIKQEELKKKIEEQWEQTEESKNILKEINDLDEKYYYNEELKPFSLNLAFIDWDKQLYDTANYIENTLKEIWIKVNKTPIALSQVKNFIEEEKSYDMILSWINLWYFSYNLFPYLHSSQVKNWYNFSKIRKTSLDILLEDLKSSVLNKTTIEEIQEKIIEILKKEQILKTLYTPKINLLVDKKIKDTYLPENIPNKSLRSEIYNNAHIKEKKIINLNDKNFVNYIKYIINKLYE